MTTATLTARHAAIAGATVAILALSACGGGKEGYANDGDSGAPAPATQPNYEMAGPADSTTGMSQRTGTPGMAGTRQGTNGDSGIVGPKSSNPGAGQSPTVRPRNP